MNICSASQWIEAMRAVIFFLAALLAPGLSLAHGLLMSVAGDGGRIVGTAYFTNGDKAAAQHVELVDLDMPGAEPLRAVSDPAGQFSFPATVSHRYRVSIFGEEGHEIQLELTAGEHRSAKLIEKNESVQDASLDPPPAWAILGAILLLSLIPVLWRRKRSGQSASN